MEADLLLEHLSVLGTLQSTHIHALIFVHARYTYPRTPACLIYSTAFHLNAAVCIRTRVELAARILTGQSVGGMLQVLFTILWQWGYY